MRTFAGNSAEFECVCSVMPPSNRRKLKSINASVHKRRRAVDMLPEFPARDVAGNVETPRDKRRRTYCGIIMFCVLIPEDSDLLLEMTKVDNYDGQYLPFNYSLPFDTADETRNLGMEKS